MLVAVDAGPVDGSDEGCGEPTLLWGLDGGTATESNRWRTPRESNPRFPCLFTPILNPTMRSIMGENGCERKDRIFSLTRCFQNTSGNA